MSAKTEGIAPNASRLLWAGFMAILAAGVGFAIRGGIFDNWGKEFGFTGVKAHSFHQDWHVASADRYIESILAGTVRARAVLAAQSGAASDGVRSYIADYLTRFRAPTGQLIVPMPAVIGSGARRG